MGLSCSQTIRARHSVRAAGCQPTRLAGRGLPALPVELVALKRYGKNCGCALKAGWMIPRDFGLRQPSAAFSPYVRQYKAAEGCRSPGR